MKVGILFSGGKDSCFAMYKAVQEGHEIACLLTAFPKNKESYMFHTPNIKWAKLQAEAIGLPLIQIKTKGEKEEELKDLERGIRLAVKKYGIEGIVSGALASEYQYSRIKNICKKLNIKSMAPLWKTGQQALLHALIKAHFKAIIVGVFAEPFTKEWLGKEINSQTIKELRHLSEKYKINPAGEGGEIETFVYNCPLFKKKIRILSSSKEYRNYCGIFNIKKAVLEEKN